MTSPEELLSLSFGEIQELEREIGLKEFQRRYGETLSNVASAAGPKGDQSRKLDVEADQSSNNKQNHQLMTKSNKKGKNSSKIEKWEPLEISSKIKPKKHRDFSSSSSSSTGHSKSTTTKIRDPRFDDLCGTFDKDLFDKGYGFIKEIRDEDERDLKKFVKSSKEEEKVEEAKQKLKAMKRTSREQTQEKKVDDKLKSMKKAELAAVKEGKKKPFFLKKSERKKLSLAEKFKELKQNGKLEKYMEKKRKRNAAKLKKALPSALEG